MPQFEIANFLPQLAWLGISFALLYFVVVRATLPKLGRVMQARDDKVTGDLASAQSAKADADRTTEAYLAELHKAQDAARAVLAISRGDAQREIEGRLAAADAKMGAHLADAQQTLDAAKSRALAEVEAIAADAAASIVERLAGTRPADTAAAAAAKAALAR